MHNIYILCIYNYFGRSVKCIACLIFFLNTLVSGIDESLLTQYVHVKFPYSSCNKFFEEQAIK